MARPKDNPRAVGRPKFPAGEQADVRFTVYITEKVAAKLDHMAKTEGFRTRSAFLASKLTAIARGW